MFQGQKDRQVRKLLSTRQEEYLGSCHVENELWDWFQGVFFCFRAGSTFLPLPGETGVKWNEVNNLHVNNKDHDKKDLLLFGGRPLSSTKKDTSTPASSWSGQDLGFQFLSTLEMATFGAITLQEGMTHQN